MSNVRRFLKQRGFTLIEILVVIVIIGVLSIMGVSKYTEFTTQSRQRGCVSNQNSIDKAIGVWESQNVAVPINILHTVNFQTNGKISGSTTGALAAPAGNQLKTGAGGASAANPGGDELSIFRFTKDLNVFTCPERANIAGGEVINTGAGEFDYQWKSNPPTAPDPILQGKTRGTVCQFFGLVNGPDGTTGTYHRP